MPLADAFEPVRSALERAGVRYAVGGSWASTVFGEPRFTNDLDILAEFLPQSVRSFLANLPPESFYFDAEEASAAIQAGRSFTAEDILLAKLYWFRLGGETSEVQWRDIEGIVSACQAWLDQGYLKLGAAQLQLHTLLEKALQRG